MMRTAMLNIFGTYEPIIITLENGDTFACVDVAYVASVATFGLCLFCLFRLMGTLFKR